MLPARWPIQDAKNPMSSPKFYSTINYDFRPESYWAPARSSLEAALRNVKGCNRREMIRDYHSRGLLPALSDMAEAQALVDEIADQDCEEYAYVYRIPAPVPAPVGPDPDLDDDIPF